MNSLTPRNKTQKQTQVGNIKRNGLTQKNKTQDTHTRFYASVLVLAIGRVKRAIFASLVAAFDTMLRRLATITLTSVSTIAFAASSSLQQPFLHGSVGSPPALPSGNWPLTSAFAS